MIKDFKKYYELTKPGIIYGNLLTLVAGFLLGSKGNLDLFLFAITVLGAYLIIASACVFNNIIDAKIDRKMKRTSNRALAKGEIKIENAISLAAFSGLIGFFMLIIFTNIYVVAAGILAVLTYLFPYSYFKRRSWFGTAVGTVPGAMPIAAGYLAVSASVNTTVIFLFLIMIFWQIPHFYALGIFRMKDYKMASLPILPVSKGIGETKLHIFIFTFLYLLTVFIFSLMGDTGLIFLIVMNMLTFYWFFLAMDGFSAKNDIEWAKSMFKYSLFLLTAFCLLLSLEVVLP